MKLSHVLIILLAILSIATPSLSTAAVDDTRFLSAAVLDFETSDPENGEAGAQIATILNALLSAEPNLLIVERQDLDKLLSEQELGLSGMTDPMEAAQIGQLTGAKVLITGRAFTSGDEYIAVARIMSTETSRVFGEMVTASGDDHLSAAAMKLAEKIATTLREKGDELLLPVINPNDRLEQLRKTVEGKLLPSVSVAIPEEHLTRLLLDPAAETEIAGTLNRLGFKILDSTESSTRAEVAITGEAFSELGLRRGNLVSCRARVEVKVIDLETGRVLLADSETGTAIDLSEGVASKTALQQTAAKLTERLVPALVQAFN